MVKISLGATQLESRDLRCVQNTSTMSAHIIYECAIELFALHIAVIIAIQLRNDVEYFVNLIYARSENFY